MPDERGFLRIVDRLKEMVITGGFNVYPSEVEEAMRDHDGIRDIAVVGLANELGVEEVVAAVVTVDGLKPDLDELRASVKERLAAYKVPRRIFVISELPRNEMGKVLRREVRARVEQMDLTERLNEARPKLRERLADAGPDVREWLAQVGPEIREKLETLGPELRERIEELDLDLRSRLEEPGPNLRARIEALDLPTRLEIFRAHLAGDDATPDAVPLSTTPDATTPDAVPLSTTPDATTPDAVPLSTTPDATTPDATTPAERPIAPPPSNAQ